MAICSKDSKRRRNKPSAMLAVLAAAVTGPEQVAKLTIYLDAGVDSGAAYAATRSV